MDVQEAVLRQLKKAGLLPTPFFARVGYAHKCACRVNSEAVLQGDLCFCMPGQAFPRRATFRPLLRNGSAMIGHLWWSTQTKLDEDELHCTSPRSGSFTEQYYYEEWREQRPELPMVYLPIGWSTHYWSSRLKLANMPVTYTHTAVERVSYGERPDWWTHVVALHRRGCRHNATPHTSNAADVSGQLPSTSTKSSSCPVHRLRS